MHVAQREDCAQKLQGGSRRPMVRACADPTHAMHVRFASFREVAKRRFPAVAGEETPMLPVAVPAPAELQSAAVRLLGSRTSSTPLKRYSPVAAMARA